MPVGFSCVAVVLAAGLVAVAPLVAQVDAPIVTQTAPAAPAAFEVASLRLVPPGQSGLSSISPWGSDRFTATNVSLSFLLSLAYGVESRYISGIPGQLQDASYSVTAKAADGQALTYEQVHAPLQSLLIERLHLTAHMAMQDRSGYRLVVSTGKKQPAPTGSSSPSAYILPNGLKAQGISMDAFAGMVSTVLQEPVKDATGLTGKYDLDLHFARPQQTDSDLPSIFTALEEQYGLKLVPAKVPMQSLVVDHVDLVPADN